MKKFKGKHKIGNQVFNLTTYEEFVKYFNIYNNEILNQENLDKGINQLKRELNSLFGLIKVLTDSESIRWQENIEYGEGEVVSYLQTDNPTTEEIRNSYYIALDNPNENIGKNPSDYPSFWFNINSDLVFPRFSSSIWAKFHNDFDWSKERDLDLTNVKYQREKIQELKDFFLDLLDRNYVPFENTKVKNPTAPTHYTTKKYVDDETRKVLNSLNDTNTLLGNYVKVDENRKLIAANNGSTFIKTTDAGILPGVHQSSVLGNANNIYKAVYAKDFMGTALKAKYADLAEIYECDNYEDFEVGDIIGLNENGYQKHNTRNTLIGVISDKPAVILNQEKTGICIALKGQTPVKVKGKVKKGQYIYSTSSEGIAYAVDIYTTSYNFIGIALESSDNEDVKLINTKI